MIKDKVLHYQQQPLVMISPHSIRHIGLIEKKLELIDILYNLPYYSWALTSRYEILEVLTNGFPKLFFINPEENDSYSFNIRLVSCRVTTTTIV